MSNYTKSTNFATKDNLTPGDPLKIVRGTEIDTEYNNIATAIATKTDNSSAAITGGTINATTIGATTASTGAFSTLSATGAITSTLATGTAPLVIASTTKVANLNVDSLDGADWASPAALGSTTPAAVSATTLTTSSTVTFNGGTANGVAYLNGSKVVTSGSALWFDGTNFGVGTGGNTLNQQSVVYKAGANTVYQQIANGSTGLGATNGIRVGVSSAGVGEWYSPTAAISYIDNSEQMRLTSTGLGIGTSSPAGKLHVSGGRAYFGANSDAFALAIGYSPARASASETYFIGATNSATPDLTFSNSTGTPNMTLTNSGNLGLGVTPSAWTAYTALQLQGANGIYGFNPGDEFGSYQNAYYNSGWKYGTSSIAASRYAAYQGTHSWYNAPSGTAGNAITFTQAMTLDASGNLLVGNTAGTGYRLNVKAAFSSTLGGAYIEAGEFDKSIMVLNHTNASVNVPLFQVQKSGTGVLTLDSSGNLLVGTTTTGSYFDGKVTSFSANTYPVFAGKQGESAASVMIQWNAGTTGDNIFTYFVTETSPTVRGSISYNRAGGLTAYNVTSDYRAKDIYGPVTNSGALIDSVPVYMGKMKDATQERPMFIAHETPEYAHTGVKDAVDADGNPVYQQMDASALIPVMWAEIQSLRKRLADAGI